jgi:hypothetical protein
MLISKGHPSKEALIRIDRNDSELIDFLRQKKVYYESRLALLRKMINTLDIRRKSPEEIKSSKDLFPYCTTDYEIRLIERLLDKGSVNTVDFCDELNREGQTLLHPRAFENACSVIQNYIRGKTERIVHRSQKVPYTGYDPDILDGYSQDIKDVF